MPRGSRPPWDHRNPIRAWARNACRKARLRATAAGVGFALTIDTVEALAVPVCPVLGIELAYGTGGGCSGASPTIDRFKPALGYVPGNVSVISHRANSIKNDATDEELNAVWRWVTMRSCEQKE